MVDYVADELKLKQMHVDVDARTGEINAGVGR